MIGPDDSIVRYNVARAYALLGELEPVLDRLEQAYRCSPRWQRCLAMWMKDNEDIDPLRPDPRIYALAERLRAD